MVMIDLLFILEELLCNMLQSIAIGGPFKWVVTLHYKPHRACHLQQLILLEKTARLHHNDHVCYRLQMQYSAPAPDVTKALLCLFQSVYVPFWNIFIHCGGRTFSHAIQNIQPFSLAMNVFLSEPGCPGVSSDS